MIKGVTFVSRKIAEDMMPVPDVGMISLTDPGSRLAALRKGWGAVLRLRFHDIDKQWQNYVLMSVDQARELLEWLEKHEEQLDGIVVHCEQGISRSAAVAKFLRERYGLPVNEPDVRFHNKLVYKLLSDLDDTRQ
jgi:predicted protein tyrosine phosphatase